MEALLAMEALFIGGGVVYLWRRCFSVSALSSVAALSLVEALFISGGIVVGGGDVVG